MTQVASDTAKSHAADQQQALLGHGGTARAGGHTAHPRAQWFPQAGLGLFIHWGIAAVHGNVDLSWGMMAHTPWDASAGGANKITPAQYWRLAEQFHPGPYDPQRWLRPAAEAGFQYAVMTAMHHDGYTLWPTRYGELGVHTHLGGRDLVGPYVEACRRFGLKVGLYYSPPDWYFDRAYMSFNYGSADPKRFPGRPAFDTHHRPTQLPPEPAEHAARRRAWRHGRVEELLTRYGRIDLLWLDGGVHDNELRDLARRLQPGLVINSRSCDGDYDATECQLPKQPFAGWLETCHCWQASSILTPAGTPADYWGYLREEQYKPAAWLIQSLVYLRAWGGNLLVNISPRADGSLPSVVYERMEEVAAWMRVHRAAVLDTTAGCWPARSNVPVTVRGRTWYLHLLPQSPAPTILSGVDPPVCAWHLASGAEVPWDWQAGELRIQPVATTRHGPVDVIALQWV